MTVHLFALIAPDLEHVGATLVKCFRHPQVESWQVGFGPPLVKANRRLVEALKGVTGALDKLELYLRHCILDDKERVRLWWLHRAIVVRQHGPVEAEEVALASTQALDLSLRLAAPPDHPLTRDPEARDGRFVIRLDDPRNERLLELPAIAPHVARDEAAAIELRVRPEAAPLFAAFLAQLSVPSFDLGDPVALARVTRDGVRH